MRRIENPDEYVICAFDGISSAAVYVGPVTHLRPAVLVWKSGSEEARRMLGLKEFLVLSLSEIRDQLNVPIITVFVEEPLGGKILQWGNYGDTWYEIGKTAGYA